MEIRKLKGKDVFKLSRILNKMGLEFNMTSVDKDGNTVQKSQTEFGMSIVMGFAENIYKAEKEVYEFVAEVTGKKVKEVEDFGIEELFEVIETIFKDEEFVGFIKRFIG